MCCWGILEGKQNPVEGGQQPDIEHRPSQGFILIFILKLLRWLSGPLLAGGLCLQPLTQLPLEPRLLIFFQCVRRVDVQLGPGARHRRHCIFVGVVASGREHDAIERVSLLRQQCSFREGGFERPGHPGPYSQMCSARENVAAVIEKRLLEVAKYFAWTRQENST